MTDFWGENIIFENFAVKNVFLIPFFNESLRGLFPSVKKSHAEYFLNNSIARYKFFTVFFCFIYKQWKKNANT